MTPMVIRQDGTVVVITQDGRTVEVKLRGWETCPCCGMLRAPHECREVAQ